jgi:hypothetical protein
MEAHEVVTDLKRHRGSGYEADYSRVVELGRERVAAFDIDEDWMLYWIGADESIKVVPRALDYYEFRLYTPEAGRLSDPSALLVDHTHIYWAAFGRFGQPVRIMRLFKRGGRAEPVVPETSQPTDLDADVDHLYWTDAKGVWRIPKNASSGPEQLASGKAYGLTIHPTEHVYWTEYGSFYRTSLDTRQTVRLCEANGSTPVFSYPHLYCTTNDAIVQLDADTGAVQATIRAEQPHALNGGSGRGIYFVDGGRRVRLLRPDGALTTLFEGWAPIYRLRVFNEMLFIAYVDRGAVVVG